MPNIFDQFVNQYSLLKTLRFELKPVGKTQAMLEAAQVFQKDEIVQSNYEQIKPFFDELHRKFVQDALKNVHLDLAIYYEEFKKEKSLVKGKADEEIAVGDRTEAEDKKKKKVPPFQKEEEKLRKAVVEFFVAEGNAWQAKYTERGITLPNDGNDGIDVLFGKETLLLLADMFPDEIYEIAGQKYTTLGKDYHGKPVNVFKWFLEEKFTTYFYRLHPSRKNFYVAEDKDTAIANRIVNENMRRFADNVWQYEQSREEYEKLGLNEAWQKIFELNFYSSCLLQAGIDGYNTTIGGSEQQNDGQMGINQKINEYNQRNKSDKNTKKLKQFKKLYKQILSPKEKRVMNDIEKDEQVFPTLQKFIDLNTPKVAEAEKVLAIFFQHAEDEEFLKEVYFKGVAINTLSSKYFLSWETLKGALMQGKGEKKKLPDFVTLAEVCKALLNNDLKADELFKPGDKDEYKAHFTENHWQTFVTIFKSEFEKSVQEFADVREKAKILIESGVAYERNDKHQETIKALCDSALGVFQMMKYFALEKGKKLVEKERNEDFYTPFETYYGSEDDFSREIVRMYDNFRNYLTKKPYSDEKWKLNFENSTLLGGWDINKEPDNYGVVLREKSSGKFFLAMPANKKENHIFDKTKNQLLFESDGVGFEKMEYKYIADISKTIPKCSTQLKKVQKHFLSSLSDFEIFEQKTWSKSLAISKNIFDLNNLYYYKNDISKSFYPKNNAEKKLGIKMFQKEYFTLSKNEVTYKNALHSWIDFCKTFLVAYKSCDFFDYSNLKPTNKYESLDQFYRDVDALSYEIAFTPISHQKLQGLNNEGKIYLFEIYSKDFSLKTTGKENLHTSYFKLLFDSKNLASPLVKLSGEAELFFRPASLKIEEEQRNFKRAIVKNKRYTENKVFFHCPIVLNFSTPEDKRINSRLNAEITKHKNYFHVIGIDRGEKHLAYYSVIDGTGKIVETASFNQINGKDYHKELVKRAGDRNEARKDWKRIANIKELKAGYISQVVRKICDLILKYNAIVVLEDLNVGFKRGRSALDFPIYQKLELALAKKLNFLVQKDAKEDEVGHPLKALQLTPPVQNFQDINRQTGVLFYTTAAYTSTTCPQCGWRKNKYIAYENIERAKEDFADIRIAFENGKFVFSYTSRTEKLEKSSKGKKKRVEEVFERDWKLYSDVARYRGQKNKSGVWEIKPYANLTEAFKNLFESKSIGCTRPNITEELIERGEALGAEFWKSLTFFWNLLCQIRNSNSEEKEDIISCPACHFHSDQTKDIESMFAVEFKGEKSFNGDANGAYNIERKGLMMLGRISSHGKIDPEFKKYPDLFISNADWDNCVTKPHNA